MSITFHPNIAFGRLIWSIISLFEAGYLPYVIIEKKSYRSIGIQNEVRIVLDGVIPISIPIVIKMASLSIHTYALVGLHGPLYLFWMLVARPYVIIENESYRSIGIPNQVGLVLECAIPISIPIVI